MLLIGAPISILLTVVTAIIGVILLSGGIQGYFINTANIAERLFLLAAGILMIIPRLDTAIIGLVVTALLIIMQRYRLLQNKQIFVKKEGS